MKLSAPLALAAFLAGCGSVATYQPYVGDVDPNGGAAALTADEASCLKPALAYVHPLDPGEIASAAAQGGARNASGAALNPLVPVLGAAGGATSELFSELGILNDDQRKVFLRCLDHRGERSGKYSVMDPNY